MITIGYLVLMCGCTDCFPNAIFFDNKEAIAYGKLNSRNPEGYVIQVIDVTTLGLRDD